MAIELEQWRELEDYPGYAVSTFGRVWNVKYDREIRGTVSSYGHRRVALSKDGRFYIRQVSQLVAKTFITGWEEGVNVKHIDGDNANDNVMNLRLGRFRRQGVVRRGSDKMVMRRIAIVETGQTFRNVHSLADFIHADRSTVYKVLRGERKSCNGYTFEFVNAH